MLVARTGNQKGRWNQSFVERRTAVRSNTNRMRTEVEQGVPVEVGPHGRGIFMAMACASTGSWCAAKKTGIAPKELNAS